MRIFKSSLYGWEWRFGKGTVSPQGDYYVDGIYRAPSAYPIETFTSGAHKDEVTEVMPYPEELRVDEGL